MRRTDIERPRFKAGELWFCNAAGLWVFADEYGRQFTSKAAWRAQRRLDRRAAGFQIDLPLEREKPDQYRD